MKCFVAFLIVLFLLVACRSDPKSMQHSKKAYISTLYYFADENIHHFTRVELKEKDSLSTIYEFNTDIGVIQKCIITSTNSKSAKCNKYIVDSVLYSNSQKNNFYFSDSLFNTNKSDFNSIIKTFNSQFDSLDSIAFWNRASLFLDSIVFNLSRDKYLLDYNYFSNKVNHDIIIDRRTLSKNIEIDKLGLPTLFFEVIINQSGKIIEVNCNSWKGIHKEVIADIKRILLTKSTNPYSILGYPIKVKMTVGVHINNYTP